MENSTVQNDTKLMLNEARAETCEKKESNVYSIYNYLKKNPATLVAIFTGVVTIITFLSQLLAYTVSKSTLAYWNFDTAYASFDKKSLLYSAIAAIVYVIIMCFSTMWFTKTCEVYIERKRFFWIGIQYCKQQRGVCKNIEKRLRKLRNTRKSVVDLNEITEIEESNKATRQALELITTETRKERRRAIWFFSLNVLPIYLLICFFAFILCFMVAGKDELYKMMLSILVSQSISFYVIYSLEKRTIINRKILKKEISDKMPSEIMEKYRSENDYPLFALLIKGDGIRNSVLLSQLISVSLVFIIFVLSFILGTTNSEKARKDFQIANMDGEQYAVVYFADNTYYMEKAIIEDDTLTVFTREQRIINTSDISFSVQTFDQVIKTDREVPQ